VLFYPVLDPDMVHRNSFGGAKSSNLIPGLFVKKEHGELLTTDHY
jgi:hypothetical protein